MAINRVEIKDFFVFKGELDIDFCNGVNVLIGGNGTGKTTLLRGLYGHIRFPHNVEPTFNIYAGGALFSKLSVINDEAHVYYKADHYPIICSKNQMKTYLKLLYWMQ